MSKSSNPTILKTSALETIDFYPKTWIQGYTDGSAFKATNFAGFGAYLKFPDGTSTDLCAPCGNICSNYEAEIEAIRSTLQAIHSSFESAEQQPTNVVLFSDSKSALEALENSHQSSDESILNIAELVDLLTKSFNITVTLQWIPGHTDIAGNEKADTLAKQGTTMPQTDKPVSYTTTKQMIQNNIKEEWMNRWASGSTGRVVYREMTKPNPRDNINRLKRHEQSIIFQLRTGHTRLNYHLNRFNPMHPPLCRNCSYPYETVEHVLFHCPSLKTARKDLLPPFPSVHNCLYGSFNQLQKTCVYFRMALTNIEPTAR